MAFLVELWRSPFAGREGAVGSLRSTSVGSDLWEASASGRGDWLLLSGLTLLTTSGLGILPIASLVSLGLSLVVCDAPFVLASCARGAEGVTVEPEMRRPSPAVVEAGPLGIEFMRTLSLVNGIEDAVVAFGDEGAAVGLGTIGFATAHSDSRFFRLAA